MMQISDCEQGSEEWLRARMGLATASEFAAILTPGKTKARDHYAFVTNTELRRVGFVRNEIAGCSPDSLIGDAGGLEIKIALPHIQLDRIIKDELPEEHKAQVQGNIWITGREWWDFTSYCPKLPPFIKHVPRDDGFIANMAGAVSTFNTELAETVDRIRRYGHAEKVAA